MRRTTPIYSGRYGAGGGNFGVVTRFHFRLYEVGDIYGGLLFLPATPDTIAGFIAAADAAPDELTTILTAMGPSENPFLPPEMHNKKLLMAHIVYGGDPEAGARAVAPFRALAQPLMDTLAPMPYAHLYHEEAGEGGEGEYHPTAASRTLFIDCVDHTVATTILDALNESNTMMRMCQLRVLGGAVARVPAEATAFAHRHRRILVVLAAMYAQPESAATQEDWGARLATALRQGEESAYVNFIGREETDLSRAAYPGATWERLRAVKRLYDPANLFRRNHNIPPAD